jgi:AraC-like DNA-binding protein
MIAEERTNMKLYIKNMVSIRCKMLVKSELERLNLPYKTVELGEVELEENISDQKREELKQALLKSGLVLMEDKKSVLVEKIKTIIIEMIHYTDELPKVNYSMYISQKLNLNYTYLANLFAEVKGTTIEQFIIIHKIERVKELIIYDELSLTDIAALMQYSSVAHLSKQFKKITGLTPSHFKQLKNKRRNPLEDL